MNTESLSGDRRQHPEDDSFAFDEDEEESQLLAERTARLPDMSMTPGGQPPEDDNDIFSTVKKNKDPLLHRVLDKNYRIQATPMKGYGGMSPPKWRVTEQKGKEKENERVGVPAWQDSPMSSPEMEAPKLRSEAFMSPFKTGYKAKMAAAGPRTPGISVQTPAGGKKTRDIFAEASAAKSLGKKKDEITWGSDSDDEFEDLYGGMSPPKTIQFALPASKLLQTPGKSLLIIVWTGYYDANGLGDSTRSKQAHRRGYHAHGWM